jgi:hypothetical protein
MIEQVGGTHYQSEYQHWHWAPDCKLGYLEGTCTKYLVRWREKDGLQDLKKSRSYLLQLIELYGHVNYSNDAEYQAKNTARFLYANQVGGREASIMLLVAFWQRKDELTEALGLLDDLINTEFPESNQSKTAADYFTDATAPMNSTVLD